MQYQYFNDHLLKKIDLKNGNEFNNDFERNQKMLKILSQERHVYVFDKCREEQTEDGRGTVSREKMIHEFRLMWLKLLEQGKSEKFY